MLTQLLALLVIALCVGRVQAQTCLDNAYKYNQDNGTYITSFYLVFEQPAPDVTNTGEVAFLAFISSSDLSHFCGANYTGFWTVSRGTSLSFNVTLASPVSMRSSDPISQALCEDLLNDNFVELVVTGQDVVYAPADLTCSRLNFIPTSAITLTFTASALSFLPSLLFAALCLSVLLLI